MSCPSQVYDNNTYKTGDRIDLSSENKLFYNDSIFEISDKYLSFVTLKILFYSGINMGEVLLFPCLGKAVVFSASVLNG